MNQPLTNDILLLKAKLGNNYEEKMKKALILKQVIASVLPFV